MCIINEISGEWGIRSVRSIPEANQFQLSEFLKSDGITVHTWRLTEPQFTWCRNNEYDIRHRLNEYGYDQAKEWVRQEFVYCNLGSMPESQCKFKVVRPSAWYKSNAPDADSTGCERFGTWYAAQFGTLLEPDIVSGPEIEATYRSLPSDEMEPMYSCMTGPHRSQFTRIYGTSPRSKMLVLRDEARGGKIIERCMIVLPDDHPVDTPVGTGWLFIRIYTESARDASLSRAKMGPWMATAGIRPVAGIDRLTTVSGFTIPDNMCLPYVDREGSVRWAWDEKHPGAPAFMQLGWYGRSDRDQYKCYPSGRYSNNFEGGPFPDRDEVEDMHCCCNCDTTMSDDDVYRFNGGSDTYCCDCYNERYTYCEATGEDVEADTMIPVHGCSNLEHACRELGSFMHRPTGPGDWSTRPRIRFIRVDMSDGSEAFVPEREVFNERWITDMEDNGWIRVPSFTLHGCSAWGTRLITDILTEDDWTWISEDRGVSYETSDGDSQMFEEPFGLAHQILRAAAVQEFTITVCSDTGRVMFTKDGIEHRPAPLSYSDATVCIDGLFVPYDYTNPAHNCRLYPHLITAWAFLPINPPAAGTAETASNP